MSETGTPAMDKDYPMATPKPKTPSASGISRLLAKDFARSEQYMRARCTAGFHVRGDGQAVYVGWRNKTPLVSRSALQAERDRRTAMEMVRQYAEALNAAGWPADVIHLNGPLARVAAKTEGCQS